VTVILLIVGHRPVFQPGPSGDLLCPPQTAPRLRTNRDLRLFRVSRLGRLSGITQYDDRVYFGSAVGLVHAAIAHWNFVLMWPPGEPSPGMARSTGRNTTGRNTTGGSRT